MKTEVYKGKVNTRDELHARNLGAAAHIQTWRWTHKNITHSSHTNCKLGFSNILYDVIWCIC